MACTDGSYFNLTLAGGRLSAEVDQDASHTNYLNALGGKNVADGTFHHFALVRQGATLRIYADGALDGSITGGGTASITNSAGVTLGAGPCPLGANPTGRLAGALDDVRVYRRALAPSEIANLHGPACGNAVTEAGESCDATACCSQSCGFAPASTPCSGGACSMNATCTGSSGLCPAMPLSAGTVCRASVGPCDTAETCSGTTTSCPPDSLAGAGTVCNPASGPCEAPGTCSGASASCSAKSLQPSGFVCNPASGACENPGTCDGATTTCGAKSLVAAGTVCRAAAGACDTPESCSGTSTACPADGYAPNGTTCGSSSCQAGSCADYLARWRFDETSGLVAHDSSPNQHDGAVSAGGTGFTPGKAAGAISLNGGSVTVPEAADLDFGVGDFSFTGWIKTGAANEIIIHKGPACSPTSFWSVNVDANGHLSAEVEQDAAGTNDNLATGSTALNDGQWHLVAVVRSGAQLELYVDGALDGLKTGGAVARLTSPANLTIGSGPCAGVGGVTSFLGEADDFRLYARALAASEISFLAGPACGNAVTEAGEACDDNPCCTQSCTLAAGGTVCRPSAGNCDVAEMCNGSAGSCPADGFVAAGTLCRASAGGCDVSETCTGS
jgi:hypothetical protein